MPKPQYNSTKALRFIHDDGGNIICNTTGFCSGPVWVLGVNRIIHAQGNKLERWCKKIYCQVPNHLKTRGLLDQFMVIVEISLTILHTAGLYLG